MPDETNRDETEGATEPTPASMAMTKDELLDSLRESAALLTKAEILAVIHRVEGGEDDDEAAAPAPAGAVDDTETRTVTVDGVKYAWTAATEYQVPQVAREVWAHSQA